MAERRLADGRRAGKSWEADRGLWCWGGNGSASTVALPEPWCMNPKAGRAFSLPTRSSLVIYHHHHHHPRFSPSSPNPPRLPRRPRTERGSVPKLGRCCFFPATLRIWERSTGVLGVGWVGDRTTGSSSCSSRPANKQQNKQPCHLTRTKMVFPEHTKFYVYLFMGDEGGREGGKSPRGSCVFCLQSQCIVGISSTNSSFSNGAGTGQRDTNKTSVWVGGSPTSRTEGPI